MADKALNQLTLLTGDLDDDDVFVFHRGDETTGVTYRIPRSDLITKLGISGGGISYTDKSAAFTMVAGEGYKATHDSTAVAATLPASPTVNDIVAIAGEGDAGWEVLSNASADSQKVVMGIGESGTSVGSAETLLENINQYDSAILLCVEGGDDSVWAVIGGVGGQLVVGNYFGDGSDGAMTFNSNTNLTSTTDGDMIVKQYSSLTINSGVTVSVTNRCKGLFIYVHGDCNIQGVLDMTARGPYVNPTSAGVSSTGLRLPMKRSGYTQTLSAADFGGAGSAVIAAVANQPEISNNGRIYVAERQGASGGVGSYMDDGKGDNGGTGTNKSGGGGGGGNRYSGWANYNGGAGSYGSCFGGGSGGGGAGYDGAGSGDTTCDGLPATAWGGAGGSCQANVAAGGGGGAGNPGGATCGGHTPGSPGSTGVGGFIALIVSGTLTIGGAAVIRANGKNGGNCSSSAGGGGGSGGGVIWLLHRGALTNSGTVQANGGSGGTQQYSDNGGAGGAGSVIIDQVS
jgi:hypothetical protein